MGIGFIIIFLLKAQVSYLTILKRKNLSFKLKQTGLYFVWFYQNVSLWQNCILTSDSEANRDGADADSSFPLFISFSASFSHKKRSEYCLRFATSGPSFCLYPL